MSLTFNEAADIIDAYGPDEIFWPDEDRDALKRAIEEDEDVSDYLAWARRMDDMLSAWEESEDGNDFGERSDDSPWPDESDDEEDEDDEEDDEEDEDVSLGDTEPGVVIVGAGSDEELEIDPDQIKDMDALFAEAIRAAIETSDNTEFRVFTRDFDRMIDIEGVSETTSIEAIDQSVAKSVGPLMKELRRLIAARSQVKRTPGMRRGRLHGPNLHRILSGDDRVFTRREEAQSLDTAITMLIDCSGSMAGNSIRLATEAAYAIASVLSRINVQFECLGFTDDSLDPRCRTDAYRKEVDAAHAIAPLVRTIPIVMPKFKAFEDRWTIPVQRRFAKVFNGSLGTDGIGFRMGSTPEGCGMEFAARRLLQRKEARKIMLVLNDGSPGGQCHDWSVGIGAYRRQSERMVQMIEGAGVDLVGIGIGHDGPTEYFTNAMVIHDVDQMPPLLLKLLKKFIVG